MPGPNRPIAEKWYVLVLIQTALAVAAMLTLEFDPPANGQMLLLPMASANVGMTYSMALNAGASVLGPGPFPGSLIVAGDRTRLLATTSGTLTLVLAAAPTGCSVPKSENAG